MYLLGEQEGLQELYIILKMRDQGAIRNTDWTRVSSFQLEVTIGGVLSLRVMRGWVRWSIIWLSKKTRKSLAGLG